MTRFPISLKLPIIALVAICLTMTIPQSFAGVAPQCADFSNIPQQANIFKVNPANLSNDWVVNGEIVQFPRYDVTGDGPSDDDGWIVTSTQSDDVILGSTRGDMINAGQGNDIVCSLDGDDFVSGGQGNDQIRGGSGNDILEGGQGNDQINGGVGNDSLAGGQDNDILYGGPQDDRLDGGPDDDIADGQLGTDSCISENVANCES